MDTYFKIKLFSDFILPAIIIILITFYTFYKIIIKSLKNKLMVKLGYEYKEGLGYNVALEFQPQWVKGNIKINYRKINSVKYTNLRKLVKSIEDR